MGKITERLKANDDTELRMLIRRLKRAEHDVLERLAKRRAALDGAGGPVSDPLYQRLSFIHDGLSDQRVGAESELSRRPGALAE